jgi:transcription initiation factor TFIID subunit TAF12
MSSKFDTKEENEHLAALEQEKARLENACAHLERSNVELGQAIQADGEDAEYAEAIRENKNVLSDYQEKIYKLSVEIAGIKGEIDQVTPQQQQQQQQQQPADGQWL